MHKIQLIAFDADDTLWHNETFYQDALAKLTVLLAPYATGEQVTQALDAMEAQNIGLFGYGIKSYVLSMIETAVKVSDGKIDGSTAGKIIALGKDMLNTKMEPLDGVEETLRSLAPDYPLIIITKGDLMDQESKLARSGLKEYFSAIEVVSEKSPETYQKIVAAHNLDAEACLMVGNSLKSDILPALQAGCWAVYVPYENTWAHELAVDGDIDSPRYLEIEKITLLPDLLSTISKLDSA